MDRITDAEYLSEDDIIYYKQMIERGGKNVLNSLDNTMKPHWWFTINVDEKVYEDADDIRPVSRTLRVAEARVCDDGEVKYRRLRS